MNCQRCRTQGVSWTNDVVTLYGGASAHLCVDCMNAWHDMVDTHPVWAEVQRLDARRNHYESLARAGRPVEEGDWLRLERETAAVRRVAFGLGVEFVRPLPVEAKGP